MLKHIISVSLCFILGVSVLAQVSFAQADDVLELDRDYRSTINIFTENQGVLQFKYPSQMYLIESNTVVELSTTLDPHTALENQETFIASMTITSATHMADVPELSLTSSDDTPSDIAELAEQLPNMLDANLLILSQTSFTIGEREVIEFVVITDFKYSIFLVENDIPLIVVVQSYDFYSEVLRNTAINMIGTFAVDMSAEVQPRNMTSVINESENIDGLGAKHVLSLANNQRGFYVEITTEADEEYFLSLTLLEGHSRPILWILDTEGNVMRNALGEYPVGGFASSIQGVFRAPQAGKYTMFISLVSNENLENAPLPAEFQFAYQSVGSLPYEGEIASETTLSFGVQSTDGLESVNFAFPIDSSVSHLFDLDIYPYNPSDILYIVPRNTVNYGIDSSTAETESQAIHQYSLGDAEGDIIIVVRDNWQNIFSDDIEPVTISLSLD